MTAPQPLLFLSLLIIYKKALKSETNHDLNHKYDKSSNKSLNKKLQQLSIKILVIKVIISDIKSHFFKIYVDSWMECCDDVGDERRNLSCILILQIYIDIDSKPAFVNLFLLPHSNPTIFVRMCPVRNVNICTIHL